MIPFDFYLMLNFASSAISEAEECDDLDAAETIWLEAHFAADDLFPVGSPANDAVRVILDAASPACTGGAGRMALWNALNAASFAVLPAMDRDPDLTPIALADARAAAQMDGLPAHCPQALMQIADEIELIAVTGAAA
jgi:hypothetical protein